jgi:predicted Zn-dependent peptidase
VLNAVVGRTSGRLYTEIRDRRGLAYSAYSSIAPYSDGGIFYAYAGTDPDTAEAVRDLLLAEVRRLRDEPISGVELENARNGEVGARILGRETSADEATVLTRDELYGLPSPEEQEARIRAVTAEDVQRVARAYLDPERMVVVVARPGDEQDDDDEAGDDEAGDEE